MRICWVPSVCEIRCSRFRCAINATTGSGTLKICCTIPKVSFCRRNYLRPFVMTFFACSGTYSWQRFQMHFQWVMGCQRNNKMRRRALRYNFEFWKSTIFERKLKSFMWQRKSKLLCAHYLIWKLSEAIVRRIIYCIRIQCQLVVFGAHRTHMLHIDESKQPFYLCRY